MPPLTPALIVRPEALDIAYRASVLNHLGLGASLAEEAHRRGIGEESSRFLFQTEVVQGLLEIPGAEERLEETLVSAAGATQGGYREAGVPSEVFERRRNILGCPWIGVPGGWSVVLDQGSPRWIRQNPFLLAKTPLTRQFFAELQRILDVDPAPLRWSHRPDEPVVGLMRHQYEGLPTVMSALGEEIFRIPTAREWEIAARGPAVDVTKALREKVGSFKPKDFPDLVQNQFEFFFFDFGGEIFFCRDGAIQKRLAEGRAVHGYRLYATPSGGLAEDEIPAPWLPTPETTTPVSVPTYTTSPVVRGGLIPGETTLPLSLIPPADWGPPNILGFHQMAMGVLNLVRADANELAGKGGLLGQRRISPVSSTVSLSAGLLGFQVGLRPAVSVGIKGPQRS